ncbi:MAG: aspartate dehydrogenase [Lachnospiraceae bacterium]|nr:aspartate dehydrogenase [Lachnospiraceae bacterium]
MIFRKKEKKSYDATVKKPVIKASICNGEQVAGFADINTGAFEEIMLIRDDADLDEFRKQFGITTDIGKIY